MLHEISDQAAIATPITAFSATATTPADIPDLIGRAFAHFATERPRPVHITVPLDILAMDAGNGWGVSQPPAPPQLDAAAIAAAAELLTTATAPLLYLGSGARGAGEDLRTIAESFQAAVVTSNGGKGILPDDHPLNLGATMIRPAVQRLIAAADVVLAVGTEIGHTDHFAGIKLDINGKLIRVDIDPRKIDDLYEAEVGIVGDSRRIIAALASTLADASPRASRESEITETRAAAFAELGGRESQHLRLLGALREAVPDDTVVYADMTQLAYTGSWGFPVHAERQWLYPAGFCTLGPALPGAIGAKLAMPDRPVMALAGDGGFMFTVQELVTGAELGLPIPIILWNNSGYQQIRGDMQRQGIATIGVNGRNPDFMALAAAMHCHGVRPGDASEFEKAVAAAFAADRPTIIEVLEGSPWLVN
jgi:thiamine pyrophosphate-dependent acetolactate synthase large subunit-like protein